MSVWATSLGNIWILLCCGWPALVSVGNIQEKMRSMKDASHHPQGFCTTVLRLSTDHIMWNTIPLSVTIKPHLSGQRCREKKITTAKADVFSSLEPSESLQSCSKCSLLGGDYTLHASLKHNRVWTEFNETTVWEPQWGQIRESNLCTLMRAVDPPKAFVSYMVGVLPSGCFTRPLYRCFLHDHRSGFLFV